MISSLHPESQVFLNILLRMRLAEGKLDQYIVKLNWPYLSMLIIMLLLFLATQNQALAAQQQEDLLMLAPSVEEQSYAKSCAESTGHMVYRRLLSGWKAAAAAKVSESTPEVEDNAGVYHLDYSSPKTHPPKNN